MMKAFKYRIYPTPEQVVMINKTIGVRRFIYNLALETKIRAWQSYGKNLSEFDLTLQLPELKKENTVALEKEIEMLRGALSELVKWCEPDDRWNYMAAIEKAKQILNIH